LTGRAISRVVRFIRDHRAEVDGIAVLLERRAISMPIDGAEVTYLHNVSQVGVNVDTLESRSDCPLCRKGVPLERSARIL